MKQRIHTSNAPQVIGPYSQALRVGNTVYLSGQIPLDPVTMTLVSADFKAEVRQVFENLRAVCIASGGSFANIVKLTVYLTDLKNFPEFNDVMLALFQEPFPARTTVEVSALPKAVRVEVDAVMVV